MNVLTLSHLYPSRAYPGYGPFVRDEVMELAKRHEVRVISPLRVPQRSLSLARQVLATPRESIEDGIPITRPRIVEPPLGGLRTAAWLWALRLDRPLRQTYREMGADLVHAHFAIPDGSAAARFVSRERVPLVLTVRGSDVLVFGQRTAGRRLLVRTLAQADGIIAVSAELADRVRQLGVASDRIRVVPGGVPYEPAMDRDSARRVLGVPDQDVCIVWIGGFVSVKQPTHAVGAFRSLDTRAGGGRKLRLVMLGAGPMWRTVADNLHSERPNGEVDLVGHASRREVWTWLCAADLLLNSSSSEGTPASVLEALGAGTPVAAYPLAGIRAALDAVDGGTIASGTAPQDLAAAVDTELSTGRDRTRLAAAARQRFDIARAADAIEDVYTAVV